MHCAGGRCPCGAAAALLRVSQKKHAIYWMQEHLSAVYSYSCAFRYASVLEKRPSPTFQCQFAVGCDYEVGVERRAQGSSSGWHQSRSAKRVCLVRGRSKVSDESRGASGRRSRIHALARYALQFYLAIVNKLLKPQKSVALTMDKRNGGTTGCHHVDHIYFAHAMQGVLAP